MEKLFPNLYKVVDGYLGLKSRTTKELNETLGN
jgi:hypothetical protein